MSGQLRSTDGRFANEFAQVTDAMLRSGADCHGRVFLDSAEPLSWMSAPEPGHADEKYLYAAAVRAVIRWTADERPTRHVEIEYIDRAREHIVIRDAPGRLGCTDGCVHVSSIGWSTVPRRVAVAPDERRTLDTDAAERAVYGDVLRAHEETRR